MKRPIAIGAAALAWLGLAAQAQAWSFRPIGGGGTAGGYVATGLMTVAKGSLVLHCTARFAGVTDPAGGARITSVAFTGGLCSSISAVGLPWIVTPTGPNAATIVKVKVKASLAGGCGPGDVPATIGPTGVITLNNVTVAPDCTIKGSVATNPPVTIVNP